MRANDNLRSGTLVPRPGLLGVAMSKVFADVWVVIAAYNEGRAIGRVLAELAALPYRVAAIARDRATLRMRACLGSVSPRYLRGGLLAERSAASPRA